MVIIGGRGSINRHEPKLRLPAKAPHFVKAEAVQMSANATFLYDVGCFNKAEASVTAGYVRRVEDHLIAMRATHAQIPLAGDRLWQDGVREHDHLQPLFSLPSSRL